MLDLAHARPIVEAGRIAHEPPLEGAPVSACLLIQFLHRQ